jgi:hypothetical protein
VAARVTACPERPAQATVGLVCGRTTLIQLAARLGIETPAYCTHTNTTKQRTQRAEALKLAIGTLSTHPERVDPPLSPQVLLDELKRAFVSFVHIGWNAESAM